MDCECWGAWRECGARNHALYHYLTLTTNKGLRVKSLNTWQAGLPMGEWLYNPPQYEQEVGEGPHGLRMLICHNHILFV